MRENLKKARENKGLSTSEIAEKLKITTRMYNYIESGKRDGNYEIWDNLEDIFKVSQRELRVQKMPGCNQAKENGLEN